MAENKVQAKAFEDKWGNFQATWHISVAAASKFTEKQLKTQIGVCMTRLRFKCCKYKPRLLGVETRGETKMTRQAILDAETALDQFYERQCRVNMIPGPKLRRQRLAALLVAIYAYLRLFAWMAPLQETYGFTPRKPRV